MGAAHGVPEADGVRIEYMPLSALVKAPRNPKRHRLDAIGASVQRFGFVSPLILDEATGRLVAGHGRLDALAAAKAAGAPPPGRLRAEAGEWLVPVVRGVAFRDPAEAEAYLLADNRLTMLGEWDDGVLLETLRSLHAAEALDGTGFGDEDIAELLRRAEASGDAEAAHRTLAERFLVPPFTVLDARQGYWQERKAAWLALGIQSELGRGGGTWRESATGSPIDRKRAYGERRWEGEAASERERGGGPRADVGRFPGDAPPDTQPVPEPEGRNVKMAFRPTKLVW